MNNIYIIISNLFYFSVAIIPFILIHCLVFHEKMSKKKLLISILAAAIIMPIIAAISCYITAFKQFDIIKDSFQTGKNPNVNHNICRQRFIKRGALCVISYKPLWETMRKKSVTTYALIYKHNFSPYTITSLKRNKSITMNTLEKLCKVLDCKPNDIIEFLEDEQ